jgi:hypothetical protein
MTEPEWDALGAYVEKLRHELLLEHWTIRIDRAGPTPIDGVETGLIDAQMEIRNHGNVGILRVHDNFRAGDPDDQRQTILHELLHLHLDRLFTDMDGMIEGFAAKQAYEATHELVYRQYERMTDALADAIAPKFDLIAWPDVAELDAPSPPSAPC